MKSLPGKTVKQDLLPLYLLECVDTPRSINQYFHAKRKSLPLSANCVGKDSRFFQCGVIYVFVSDERLGSLS